MKDMKAGQYFALITGIVFTLVGIMGFIPGLVKEPLLTPETAGLGFTSGYGYLLGLFPINVLHNFVHLTVGVLGIFASFSLGSTRLYSGALALFYALLAVMGFIPATQSTFGFIPIFGNNVWLHALTAAIAFYFGFIATPNLLELRRQEDPTHSQG
ncbi:MAG: DUF4383 domain-containing protein [Chroococcidiopsidaceae cyanobacterium CP_BM_ER_R8_30]|nr:DUF4383 domain-containing protein [Chroococcidiopsidaceae cyanobacterium CP_BM_ER_R8_30]